MPPRDKAKGHGRSKVDPAGWIVPAHDAGLIVSDSVQALDGRTVTVQHACERIGFESGEGAETNELLHIVDCRRAFPCSILK